MKEIVLAILIILTSLSNAFAALEDVVKKGMTYDQVVAKVGKPTNCSKEEYWEGILNCSFELDKFKHVIFKDSIVLYVLDDTTFQRQIEIRKLEKTRVEKAIRQENKSEVKQPSQENKSEVKQLSSHYGVTPFPWDNASDLSFEPLPIEKNTHEVGKIFEGLKTKIAYNLKDPSSAIFRNVKVMRAKHIGGDKFYFCGEINAKNSYGAYAGYEPFFVDDDEAQIGKENFTSLKKINEQWYNFKRITGYCLTRGEPVEF